MKDYISEANKIIDEKFYKSNYKYKGFNITVTANKPSDECIEEFREYWHDFFEKKTRELLANKENDS
jgi:hypothetical protein